MPLFNCSFTLSGAQSPCSMYLGMIRIVLNVSAPCMLQQYARMGFAYICLELQVCKIRGACVFLSVFMLSASYLLVFTGDPFLSLSLTKSLPLSYECFPFLDSTNTYKCKVLKHVPCPPLTHPPWNFRHKMGGHVPRINHHFMPGRVCSKKWGCVLSFCRDHFWMLEGLISYIFFHRLIL